MKNTNSFVRLCTKKSIYFNRLLFSKVLFLAVVTLALNFISLESYATHAVGGEITYTSNGPNSYNIKLSLYRDCDGINLPSSQNIQIDRCNINQNLTLQRTSITDVTILCASQVSSCGTPSGFVPGVQEHVYEAVITFPSGCNNITFNYQLCCRTNSVTNLNIPGSQELFLSATLDNTTSPVNNSPQFLTLSNAKFCYNQPVAVSLAASDPDGDSLSYTLINARQQSNQSVNYTPPYSGTNPLSSSTPIVLDPITGLLTFTPNQISRNVVAVLVREYRNGILIGTISRDVDIFIINCAGNNSPTIVNVPNQTAIVGQQLCIPIVANDVNGDLINLTVSSGITPAPSFVINSSVAGTTTGTLCYTPTIDDSSKTFTIAISAIDDFCPIPATTASSFTINVLRQCNVSISIANTPSTCGNPDGTATANVSTGVAPYTYAWTGPGVSSTNQTINSLAPGRYYVTVTDAYNCTAADSVDIVYNGSVITLNGSTTAASCGLSNGTLTANGSNGIAPYSYSLNGGPSQSGNTFSNLAPGPYIVTVTDPTTCPTTGSFVVNDLVDIIAPVANCQNFVLNLANGVGMVLPSDIDNGSTDNCAIASMTVVPNSFSCADAGNNTVTLTVTDAQGNNDNCTANVLVQYQPSCSISVTPSNNTYTGGDPTIIYLGYGPQSATLNGSASGGANFTYSWSPAMDLNNANSQNPIFTPTATGNFTYTLTATNDNGCSTTCDVTFCVVDVEVPGKKGKSSGKVYLCHVPPGNSSNSHLLTVSVNAVSSHLGNHAGDQLGSCGPICVSAKTNEMLAIDIPDDGLTYTVYPNPTNGLFNLYVASLNDEEVNVVVYDMTGRQMLILHDIEFFTTISFGENFSPGMYMVRVTQGNNQKNTQIVKSE